MSQAAGKIATYEDLYTIPENMVGEIIDGELLVTPRPSVRHNHAASVLGGEVAGPYHLGRGGPGGWIILDEQEIMLGQHLLVPDMSGWRRERFPEKISDNWISVAPDWVCEVLSPGTIRIDKVRKMPLYGQYGVPHLWFMDPVARTLEVFGLESSRWVLMAVFSDEDRVRAEPFTEIEISLGDLWLA